MYVSVINIEVYILHLLVIYSGIITEFFEEKTIEIYIEKVER